MKNLHHPHDIVDFIGLGAQKAGTSWIYACLYEHPEICMPYKEINFFSRERNWKKGLNWYRGRFKTCPKNKFKGEYSTSYLDSATAAKRIYNNFPDAKLIACLRNPIDRAFSNYINGIKRGRVPKNWSFEDALRKDKKENYLEQGFYYKNLQYYLKCFDRDKILIIIYEDIKKDPLKFIQKIYKFLNVEESFVPSLLESRINIARTPKFVFVDRIIHHTAKFLREKKLHKLVWWVKKKNIPTLLRKANTKKEKKRTINPETRKRLKQTFKEDIEKLSKMLNRNLTSEWL